MKQHLCGAPELEDFSISTFLSTIYSPQIWGQIFLDSLLASLGLSSMTEKILFLPVDVVPSVSVMVALFAIAIKEFWSKLELTG